MESKTAVPARGVYRRAGFKGSVHFVAFDSAGELRLVVKALAADSDDYIVGWMEEYLDRKDPLPATTSRRAELASA